MLWSHRTYTSVGVRHKKHGQPCQDAAQVMTIAHILIGAVSDGAGSATYGEVGAQLAVASVVTFMAQHLAETAALGLEVSPEAVQQLLQAAVESCIEEVTNRASTQGAALQDFSATLITWVAWPKGIAALQIGDGFLVGKKKGDDIYDLLAQPTKGEYVNTTAFITSPYALAQASIFHSPETYEFLCCSTDGLERLAIKFPELTPFPPFFMPLESFLDECHQGTADDSYIRDFLESERLNLRTDDDKTLVLAKLYEITHASSDAITLCCE